MKEEFLKINGLPVDIVKQSFQPFICTFLYLPTKNAYPFFIHEAYLICWLDE